MKERGGGENFVTQKSLVQRCFSHQSLPPVWLLQGPCEVDKKSFALWMAQELLIIKNPHLSEREYETHVGWIQERVHPNFLCIEGEQNGQSHAEGFISVENVRAIATFISHGAIQSGWRVVLIHTADQMNKNAMNALLKMIEEPPPQVCFLLVAHRPEILLPTLRSRCFVLKFFLNSALPLSLFDVQLQKILQSQRMVSLLKEVLSGNFTPLSSLSISETQEKWREYHLALLSLVYHLVCEDTVSRASLTPDHHEFIRFLSAQRDPYHWILVWDSLLYLFQKAQDSHLDSGGLQTACFLCFYFPHFILNQKKS